MFGRRLKEERIKRNLTQKQLGAIVGVSATMIMYYERGTKKPSFEQLVHMADCLGLDVNYLLGFEYSVREEDSDYIFHLAKQEVQIIRELRSKKELYAMLVEDPKRTIELIARKMS